MRVFQLDDEFVQVPRPLGPGYISAPRPGETEQSEESLLLLPAQSRERLGFTAFCWGWERGMWVPGPVQRICHCQPVARLLLPSQPATCSREMVSY